MTAKIGWLLNFNADEELESPASYRGLKDEARYHQLATRLRDLTGDDEVVSPFRMPLLAQAPDVTEGEGRIGFAWMMTPYASRTLLAHGFLPTESPKLEVLSKVNARTFASRLGVDLPGATYGESVEEVLRSVSASGETGEWLLSRPFGYVGRGKRKVRAGLLSSADQSWIQASIERHGGLEITPWVKRDKDYALHGFVRKDGSFTVGELTEQACDANGQWSSTKRASDVAANIPRGIVSALEETAEALHRAGFFGPFGIDAFTWIDNAGRKRLLPRCEINARFSMGWAIGMGPKGRIAMLA